MKIEENVENRKSPVIVELNKFAREANKFHKNRDIHRFSKRFTLIKKQGANFC